MRARQLKPGMLVQAKDGYTLVVGTPKFRPPGVTEGELSFTVVRWNAARYIKTLVPSTRVLKSRAPIMYYNTTRTKTKKRAFTKHTFLVGSDLVYLGCNHCRGLEPVEN